MPTRQKRYNISIMKETKRTITYTIDQKIKDLHKAIVKGDKEKIERLQKYIDYFDYGIK